MSNIRCINIRYKLKEIVESGKIADNCEKPLKRPAGVAYKRVSTHA